MDIRGSKSNKGYKNDRSYMAKLPNFMTYPVLLYNTLNSLQNSICVPLRCKFYKNDFTMYILQRILKDNLIFMWDIPLYVCSYLKPNLWLHSVTSQNWDSFILHISYTENCIFIVTTIL